MYHHLFDFCICSHHRQVDGGATKGVPGELAFSTVLLLRVVTIRHKRHSGLRHSFGLPSLLLSLLLVE
jgi:hypothetical protein